MCGWMAAAAGADAAIQMYAISEQKKANKQIAYRNADRLEYKADQMDTTLGDAGNDALRTAGQVSKRGAQAQAGARGALAQNGVIVSSGSAMDWETGIANEVAGDIREIGMNYRREISQIMQQQSNLRMSAEDERVRGDLGVAAGNVEMVSTAIRGGGNIAAASMA